MKSVAPSDQQRTGGSRLPYLLGDLAVLDIEKGKPFEPDAHRKAILEKTAEIANAQIRVQAFADRRFDRIVWPDR